MNFPDQVYEAEEHEQQMTEIDLANQKPTMNFTGVRRLCHCR